MMSILASLHNLMVSGCFASTDIQTVISAFIETFRTLEMCL